MRKPGSEHTTKITILPFYGGVKGQSLQIVESSDGTVMTQVIKTPENYTEEINPMDLEYPALPSKYDKKFSNYLKTINNNALNILSLQENLKTRGKLSDEEKQLYQENMNKISQATDELTILQEDDPNSNVEFENREGLGAWFERKNKIKEISKAAKANATEVVEQQKLEKGEENNQSKWWNKIEGNKEKKKGETDKQKPGKGDKENEEEKEEENGDGDSVQINLPPDEASVAEAMPIGLAVAGEGGVAASKPVATAVVGPYGLAVARPIATAIAGVAPEQALIPAYAEGYLGLNKPKRNGSQSNKKDSNSQIIKIISKYHKSSDHIEE
ncbi:hypothetical protein WA026_006834 [Henosepilachna vigintioctopunctata]|uniref:DUF4774 domain-containing protein n=1 Tax=Henosepilachna vigintioctopunctata TaxID=420089 RepID=A0AAW1UA24_9CUCU